MADEQKKKMMEEEARRIEEERVAAEKEFLERHKKESRLSSQRRLSVGAGGGYTSATSSQAGSESESDSKKRNRSTVSPDDKEKKKTKSRKTEDEEIETEEDEASIQEDPLVGMFRYLKKMRGWFRQPTIIKMVTKPQTEKLLGYVERCEEELIKAREERVRLMTRAEDKEVLVTMVRSAVREELGKTTVEETQKKGLSYAEMAGKRALQVPKVTGIRGPMLPAPKRVFVKHDTKESEDVKTTLKNLVRPQEIGLKVRRVINIRNGVIVEAENEEGLENLMKQKALSDAGLKVEKPPRVKPVIMIYDVSTELSDEEIKREVYFRNLSGSGVEEEEFNKEFEIRHKYKDTKSEGRKNHIVAECSVEVRNRLRDKQKIYVEWQCCRVKDYLDVAQCYKCQRFGHIAKHCNRAEPSCSYCAGAHDFKACPNKKKDEQLCCVNCKREGRGDVKHEARSRRCPAYEKAVKRYKEKIDYGL